MKKESGFLEYMLIFEKKDEGWIGTTLYQLKKPTLKEKKEYLLANADFTQKRKSTILLYSRNE